MHVYIYTYIYAYIKEIKTMQASEAGEISGFQISGTYLAHTVVVRLLTLATTNGPLSTTRSQS